MKVKPGQKLLANDGQIWKVLHLNHPRPGRVFVKSEAGDFFDVDHRQLAKHARKLRFWHRRRK